MTKYDETWAAEHEQQRKWLEENGMFRAEEEKSSCGVGLVVSIDTVTTPLSLVRLGAVMLQVGPLTMLTSCEHSELKRASEGAPAGPSVTVTRMTTLLIEPGMLAVVSHSSATTGSRAARLDSLLTALPR